MDDTPHAFVVPFALYLLLFATRPGERPVQGSASRVSLAPPLPGGEGSNIGVRLSLILLKGPGQTLGFPRLQS